MLAEIARSIEFTRNNDAGMTVKIDGRDATQTDTKASESLRHPKLRVVQAIVLMTMNGDPRTQAACQIVKNPEAMRVVPECLVRDKDVGVQIRQSIKLIRINTRPVLAHNAALPAVLARGRAGMALPVLELGLACETRIPDRFAKDAAQASQPDSIGQFNDSPMNVAIRQLAAPDVLPVLIVISVVVARNEPQPHWVEGCEFQVQRLRRLHVTEQHHGHGFQPRYRLRNMTVLAVCVAAKQN